MEINKAVQTLLRLGALENDWLTAVVGSHLHALLRKHVMLDVVRVQILLEEEFVVLQESGKFVTYILLLKALFNEAMTQIFRVLLLKVREVRYPLLDRIIDGQNDLGIGQHCNLHGLLEQATFALLEADLKVEGQG